jgi:hypothetical protein
MTRLMLFGLIAMLAFGCLQQVQGSLPSADGVGRAAPALSSAPSAGETYVTKTGYITLRVQEGTLQESVDSIEAKLKAQGANISDISYNEYGDRKQYVLTTRVLPSRFEAVNSMLQEAGEVKGLSVQLEDVTKQYTDLDLRIKNKQVELDRLYVLYNKSTDISDLLDVEREISRVETDLELLEQQKDSLSSAVERSTIVITVYEDKPATEQLSPLEGIVPMFFAAVAAAITLMVLAAGFLIPIGIVVWLLWMAYKRVSGRKARPRQSEHSRIPPPQ